ncbi:MAG TPA: DNA topoisomerase (ATP-hydrolyzing) subunit B [Candidatus Paceibacterota bacterium]|jgi:DNA gyrase subunit B|nr:DNA topoisomerase (ATP-hydrolyzing) subunit B [Candidatus Paceibacterota bacterium]
MAGKEPKKAAKKEDSNKASASYGAKDIFVLEGLEPVRKRPGMYIGSTGNAGLHHLIWEIVDNSIDEAMAGRATTVTVELLPDNKVSVQDDGAGIPVDTHPQTKKSTLETVLTTLHAGGKFGGEGYKVSGGLHGVGASVVNALSDWLKVEVERDGGRFEQEYERGKPKYKVRKVGASKSHGTKITFSPDPQIFLEMGFNEKTILERLRQQAYLTKGVRINFFDRRKKVPEFYGFYFEGGVLSFVRFLTHKKNTLQEDIFYVEKEHEKMDVEVAFVYIDDTRTQELSFANNINTPEGGMHLTGFKAALTRSLNSFARAEGYLKEKEENLTSDDVREGLVLVLSVKLREPQFEGQTKAKLGNPEARTVTESVVSDALKEFLEKHPQEAKAIIAKVILTSKARLAAKAARETVLRKGAFEGLTLPGKLADCISKDASESELFIVEGDSAGGTAKQGRNRHTQAILPLRGKILNVERARLDKMLANAEVRALVVAIGTAIGEEFNLEKLRYHKIVIMTDADVDGAHIRTLLLTLFYRYFRSVVDGGYVYIAQPPLFRVQLGKAVRYAFSETEREKAIAEMQKTAGAKSAAAKAGGKKGAKAEKNAAAEDNTGEIAEGEAVAEGGEGAGDGKRTPNVQRYKGLGEMNAEQLWETTMNPENRLMKQVTVEDAEKADKLFDVLMGDVVEPRKNFIQAHAASVRNLDI